MFSWQPIPGENWLMTHRHSLMLTSSMFVLFRGRPKCIAWVLWCVLVCNHVNCVIERNSLPMYSPTSLYIMWSFKHVACAFGSSVVRDALVHGFMWLSHAILSHTHADWSDVDNCNVKRLYEDKYVKKIVAWLHVYKKLTLIWKSRLLLHGKSMVYSCIPKRSPCFRCSLIKHLYSGSVVDIALFLSLQYRWLYEWLYVQNKNKKH